MMHRMAPSGCTMDVSTLASHSGQEAMMLKDRRSGVANTWQLAEAKNKFSEVFTRTIEEGPQRVTRRGEEIVLLSAGEYDELVASTKPKKDFIQHLLSIPKGEDLVLTRTKSPMRKIEW